VAKSRTKENIIDSVAVSYLSHLLKVEESTIDKITEEKKDALLVIEQASKKRLNKKRLLDLHPKLSSMLMVFKVGHRKGLNKDQCEFLSEAFYKYFFCLKNIKNISFDTAKPNLEGACLCLVLVVFFESAIKQYCEAESDTDSYEDSRSRYIEYIKLGFAKAKINIDLDKAIEVFKTIKEKYI
jgi:hypothetical protein|tara:strand:+ start:45 stop:593 length:549 start_codon:yes stop_codon:yes gene_type:complete